MSVADELFKIANSMEAAVTTLKDDSFSKPLQALIDVAEKVGNAWSGSWLGYHSRVYYADLAEPPPGARFSQEWGFGDGLYHRDTFGDWKEYRFDDVIEAIKQRSGSPETTKQERTSKATAKEFEDAQSNALSLLSSVIESRKDDKFLEGILEKVEGIKILGKGHFIEIYRPRGQIMSRDMLAIQAGLHAPPHIKVLADIHGIRSPFSACEELSKFTRRAASHLQNLEKHKTRSQQIGTNVFIGHGRSSLWKDLKDFIQDRMHLPWDEFNRVPVAGFTNIARLSQMLDESAIAFLLMTAEDEQADGKQHARQNVIHEAGLFQGRLGFERAIILLEEGCEEFSNVQGLGQIRFPKGNVSAVFEDIRRVLEREKLVDE
ncbi:MAG: nucleotide-binding protein [Candidatus Cloacimonetes bacterium]|nr:nucleotide-binding protein [Candidatus Cloacimonadota bacterium]